MIVIGLDVHKQSLTGVAVDEAGRMLDETVAASGGDLLAWAAGLREERSFGLLVLERESGWRHFDGCPVPGCGWLVVEDVLPEWVPVG